MKEKTVFPNPHWLLDGSEDKQTEFVVVLASTHLHEDTIKLFQQLLNDNNVVIDSSNTLLSDKATEIYITVLTQQAWELFQELLATAAAEDFDVAVLPVSSRKKKLLVCDMDSTIVKSETLDDVAERIGIGEQVSKITTRAMCGELDFRQALQERISLLKNMSEMVINEAAETLQFNPGAEILVRSAHEHGIRTVLVSGGFEPIVKVVAEKLGFDRYICNQMEISDNKLTGKVLEPIVDASTKLGVLKEECQSLGIKLEEACSIGDGANDLPLLQAAGLGIAFQGKPLLRTSIPYQLNSSGLDTVLLMMSIAG
ncbi:MAG: phosphoserine phosphatase SerB [Proteobacteria bacterium]|nr:phosphoserine phosphatase SerB [Pseudomonadota bacterium]